MLRTFLAVALLMATAIAGAAGLTPFQAEYRIYVDKIPLPVKATLKLQPGAGPDQYTMVLHASSWLVNDRERSRFQWQDCQPRSHHYLHEFHGFGKHRLDRMTFRWSPPEVTNQSADGKEKTFAIPDDAMDVLSALLRARCVFANDSKTFHVTTVYGDDIDQALFVVTGEEKLKTPMGKLETLVVKQKRDEDDNRKTVFWIAPELDYMVVKALHVKGALLHGELVMTKYKRQNDE